MFYEIEIVPTNIPAKNLLSGDVTKTTKWFTEVLFRGLVEDTYESLVKEAAKAGRVDDVRSMYFQCSRTRAKIGLARELEPTQSVSRYTLAQRVKQMSKGKKQSNVGQVQITKQTLMTVRLKYATLAIENAITLHNKRMYQRHFQIP